MKKKKLLFLDLYRLKQIDKKILSMELDENVYDKEQLKGFRRLFRRRSNYFPKAISKLENHLKGNP
jgi:hypothetical protein